jgi:hypothetical protein
MGRHADRCGLSGRPEVGMQPLFCLTVEKCRKFRLWAEPKEPILLDRSTGEAGARVMNPIFRILLRRSLVALGAILVWTKTLARGSADTQSRSIPDADPNNAAVRSRASAESDRLPADRPRSP